MMIPLGDLGQMYKQASDGTVVDCDLPENLAYGVCWNPWAPEVPASAVPSMNPAPSPAHQPAPVVTPDNPNPLILPPSSGAAADATITATLDQQRANNDAAIKAYIQNMQNKGAAPQPCSQTIFPVLNICDSSVYWGLGITAAVITLLVAAKR